MTLPERLRAAREEHGWSVGQVGEQLRLPARVIARIEAGDYGGLGAPIYCRGYLRSFARLVEVPESEVEAALGTQTAPEPELVATGVMARSEYVAERYLRPATYIALTALIALPVAWWAASGRLTQELAGQRSFDLQPPPLVALPEGGEPVRAERPALLLPAPKAAPPEIMRASMMVMPPEAPARPNGDADPGPSAAAPAAVPVGEQPGQPNAIGAGRHEALLQLSANSWVEVRTADGRSLEQALLTPGEWRFRSDGPLALTIGNSHQVRLLADGDEVDLDPVRSSNNVARIALFDEDG